MRLRACQALEALLQGSESYLAIAEDRYVLCAISALQSIRSRRTLLAADQQKHLSLLFRARSARSSANFISSLLLSSTLPPRRLSPISFWRFSSLQGFSLKMHPTVGYKDRWRNPWCARSHPSYNAMVRHSIGFKVLSLKYLRDVDDSLIISALSALAAISCNVYDHPSTLQHLDAAEIARASGKVLQASRSPEVHIEAWSLLAIVAAHCGDFDLFVATLDSLRSRI